MKRQHPPPGYFKKSVEALIESGAGRIILPPFRSLPQMFTGTYSYTFARREFTIHNSVCLMGMQTEGGSVLSVFFPN